MVEDEEIVAKMYHLEIPLFWIKINVLIGETCKEAAKLNDFTEKAVENYSDDMYGAFVYSHEDNLYAILLAEDAGIDTVSHECFHAVMEILHRVGLKYSEDSEKSFAYSLGYLTKEVWNFKQSYEEEFKAVRHDSDN